jgi:PA domain
MKVTRRALLGSAAGFVGTLLLGDNVPGKSRRKHARRGRVRARHSGTRSRAVKSTRVVETGPLSGAKLFEDVIAYYNFGEHRTAGAADLRTSQWLADQLRATGLQTTFQPFSLRQFSLRQSRLSIGSKPIRCFPVWFPRATNNVLNAPLAVYDKSLGVRSVKDGIAVVRFPFDARAAIAEGSGHEEKIRAAANAGACAVIAITEGSTKEIIALNTPAGAEPWPIPVVLVGERDAAAVMSAASSNQRASLLVDGNDDRNAAARNVIGRLNRGKDLIVVSTPQSGWFRCAAERGPGIALFLGLARWASQRSSGSSFLFVSTSGHELGGLGMRAFQKDLAPPPNRVLCWVHLGAGIAAYTWEETATGWNRLHEPDSRRYLMTSPDLVPVLTTTFAGQPGLTPTTGRAVGEFEFMLKGGYRTFGIAAGHRFHHTPADSPEMTGPEILAPVARALVSSLEDIEAGAGR